MLLTPKPDSKASPKKPKKPTFFALDTAALAKFDKITRANKKKEELNQKKMLKKLQDEIGDSDLQLEDELEEDLEENLDT